MTDDLHKIMGVLLLQKQEVVDSGDFDDATPKLSYDDDGMAKLDIPTSKILICFDENHRFIGFVNYKE